MKKFISKESILKNDICECVVHRWPVSVTRSGVSPRMSPTTSLRASHPPKRTLPSLSRRSSRTGPLRMDPRLPPFDCRQPPPWREFFLRLALRSFRSTPMPSPCAWLQWWSRI